MGVKGLWKLLEPAGKHVSLYHFAVEEGFIRNQLGDRALRLGIDAMGWVYRACYRHTSTQNPELATLYARCSRLLQLPIVPLFVFDGPGRPTSKRGKHVRGNCHWIEVEFKEMLNGFGFVWVDAPGEGEAELAQLSKRELLDAILTEDSDSFVFGAKTVMRIDDKVRDDKEVIVYKASDIAAQSGLLLRAIDFVLIALLVGGDYHKGIKGCGIEIASGIARTGLAQSLEHGLRQYTGEALQAYLQTWRGRLVDELKTNRSSYLPRRCVLVARNVPSDFPSPEMLHLYVEPLVSNANYQPPCLFANLPLSPNPLARFAQTHFRWNTVIDILEHFSTTIFPGFALHQAIEVIREHDFGIYCNSAYISPALLKRTAASAGTCKCHPEARVHAGIPVEIIHGILECLNGPSDPRFNQQEFDQWVSTSLPRLRCSVPTTVIEALDGWLNGQ